MRRMGLAFIALVAFAGVASADAIDLTFVGATSPVVGSTGTAIVLEAGIAPTGSGTIQSFVRLSTNNPIEQGYNTDFRPLQFDENNSPTFTRDLPLSALPIVNFGTATNYYEFGLDINQSGNDGGVGLVLDDVRIFQFAGAFEHDYPTAWGTPVWAMDFTGTDNEIFLNYSLNSGSGKGDMFLYVPTTLFNSQQYVYLYSHFGGITNGAGTHEDPYTQGINLTGAPVDCPDSRDPNPHTSLCGPWFNNDGFEEWFVRQATIPPPVPEPASMVLLGTGLVGLGWRLRRRQPKK